MHMQLTSFIHSLPPTLHSDKRPRGLLSALCPSLQWKTSACTSRLCNCCLTSHVSLGNEALFWRQSQGVGGKLWNANTPIADRSCSGNTSDTTLKVVYCEQGISKAEIGGFRDRLSHLRGIFLYKLQIQVLGWPYKIFPCKKISYHMEPLILMIFACVL